MQTQIASRYRGLPATAEAEEVLRSCVHCGFCNATCPTYRLTADELDGPRGRIYQIKQVLEGEPPGAAIRRHLDRCLSCRACETTCPSGVDYHRLLDIGRELVEREGRRPLLQRWQRRLLAWGLSDRQRVRGLLSLAGLVRPLLPARLRRQLPRAAHTTVTTPRTHERRMLLLDGCVQPATTPQINARTIGLFDRLGIELRIVAEAGCCGALHHHLGDGAQARRKARANIDAWWPLLQQGAEAIVVTASGCAPMVKDYGVLLQDDPRYAERAARVASLTRDLAEVLAAEDLSPLDTSAPRRIAFHSPCSLQHAQKLDGVVEGILRRLGFELVPVRDAQLCCGSAGTYSILQPRFAERLRRDKLEQLQRGQPQLIATANIGCLLHLQPHAGVPVVHWVELLTADREPALGLPPPP
ncbi:MAG TPA: glycolate oxidase subunit GlcF [Gammaproteobacteria bacterium]|nr:glycolate oxidase subunit GlcF [Gammaproteobacteria bacterium]